MVMVKPWYLQYGMAHHEQSAVEHGLVQHFERCSEFTIQLARRGDERMVAIIDEPPDMSEWITAVELLVLGWSLGWVALIGEVLRLRLAGLLMGPKRSTGWSGGIQLRYAN